MSTPRDLAQRLANLDGNTAAQAAVTLQQVIDTAKAVLAHEREPVPFSGGIGSNFYRAPIEMDCPMRWRRRVFPGTEWYYHAVKVTVCGAAMATIDGEVIGNYELYDLIVEADTPAEAKRLGRLVPFTPDEARDWDYIHALPAMLEANLAKYTQNEVCRDWLLSTDDAPLFEHRPDPTWGDNMDGTGRNLLGLVLMLVRARIR